MHPYRAKRRSLGRSAFGRRQGRGALLVCAVRSRRDTEPEAAGLARGVRGPRAPGGRRRRELHAGHARSARRRLRVRASAKSAHRVLLDIGVRGRSGDGGLRQSHGQHHPGAERSHDDLGRTGADPPVRVGVPFADLCAPVFAVVGILAALRQRDATGSGEHVDVSMLGASTSLVAAEPFDLLEALWGAAAHGAHVPRLTPFGVYESADGDPLSARRRISSRAGSSRPLAGLSSSAIRASPPATRESPTRKQSTATIETFTRSRPTAELVPLFELQGVPAAPVCSPAEAVRDPRVLARGETVSLEHPELGRVADLIGPRAADPVLWLRPRRGAPCTRTRPGQRARVRETGSATAPTRSSGCARPGISEANDERECHR